MADESKKNPKPPKEEPALAAEKEPGLRGLTPEQWKRAAEEGARLDKAHGRWLREKIERSGKKRPPP